MSATIQYEVYALQRGRWILHSRHGADDRRAAEQDAHKTEAETGFPTKIVRERHDSEINDTERITIFVSPRAKAGARKGLRWGSARSEGAGTPEMETLGHSAASGPLARDSTSGGPARHSAQVNTRHNLTSSQILFRVVVAGGVSLLAATLGTGVIAWVLHRLALTGIDIAGGGRSTLLITCYTGLFLLFFWTLFRSRLPVHRLLADLWRTNPGPLAASLPRDSLKKPPSVIPLHAGPPLREALRDQEDLKTKRGDTQAEKPREVGVEGSTRPAALAEAAPPKPDATAPGSEERGAPAAKPVPAPSAAAAQAQHQELARDAPDQDAVNLGRAVLRRFVLDVVKPAVLSSMPDDPGTRRAAAVVLAGSAAGVAHTGGLTAAAELELLTDALQHLGISRAGIDSFMRQRLHNVSTPANAILLTAGRGALEAYLSGSTDAVAAVAQALASWRNPPGQTIFPNADHTTEDDTVGSLHDVYMLTELRESRPRGPDENLRDTLHDRSMGMHNSIARAAIAAYGGREVKHTGKGIFARFPNARTAAEAALNIQRGFTQGDSKLAVALIGNTVAGEDPAISPELIRQAQEIIARTGAGEILCEARVQAEVRQSRNAGEAPGGGGIEGKDLQLVRLPVSEPDIGGLNPSGRADAGTSA